MAKECPCCQETCDDDDATSCPACDYEFENDVKEEVTPASTRDQRNSSKRKTGAFDDGVNQFAPVNRADAAGPQEKKARNRQVMPWSTSDQTLKGMDTCWDNDYYVSLFADGGLKDLLEAAHTRATTELATARSRTAAAKLAVDGDKSPPVVDPKTGVPKKSPLQHRYERAQAAENSLAAWQQSLAVLLAGAKSYPDPADVRKLTDADRSNLFEVIADDLDPRVYSWVPAASSKVLQGLQRLNAEELTRLGGQPRSPMMNRYRGRNPEGATEARQSDLGPFPVFKGKTLVEVAAAVATRPLVPVFYRDPEQPHVMFRRLSSSGEWVAYRRCRYCNGKSWATCPYRAEDYLKRATETRTGGKKARQTEAANACVKGSVRLAKTDTVSQDWECLYFVDHEGALQSFWCDIRADEGSGGNGKARADRVGEVDYRWLGNYQLGLTLGLSSSLYACSETDSLCKRDHKDVEKERHTRAADYPTDVLDKMFDGLKGQKYHLTNIPIDGEEVKVDPKSPSPAVRGADNTRKPEDQYRLGGSEILYFKRFKSTAAIQKELKKAKKNGPDNPERPLLAPVTRTERKNYLQTEVPLRKKRKEDAPKKGARREPVLLSRGNRESRLDAKRAMGGISATDHFANSFTVRSNPQEWCHLQGHGDGGTEVEENFVCGSRHCNTEQLAMETGHRKRSDPLGLKVTAYLKKGGADDDHCVAEWVRYKLYFSSREGWKKIFDHVYHAQSQSFDYNEFLILETTITRVVLAAEKRIDDYKEARKAINEDYDVSPDWIKHISEWVRNRGYAKAGS